MATLPTGTVTFLFTDVERSTKLLHSLGADGYAAALAKHRRIMREAFAASGGVEVDTQGDAFFIAFPTADGALAAARAITEGLAPGPIKVRMGLHTGTPLLTDEGYIGTDVHRTARIAAAGHGGQVLLSPETVALVGTDGLRDLGEHRLKDFDQPTPIFQVGDERFPPLKTVSNTNLPRPASSFVGREAEVAQLAAQLRDGARLVTLTGPGGSGKTRLAIETAATLVADFKAGVFWIDLAPLRDPVLVPETMAQVIGAKDGLVDHIGQREMLLVLDNLEQIIEAAPGLAALVEACPNLRLLVTSRERLRVRGEVEVPVAPLPDPDAVTLFCSRAKVEPDEAVHQLCLALDNLPLALELAAARASVLTPAQILDRLSGRLDLLKGGRDADPRQQTLRVTIEWSHELLSQQDQRLFAHLAVFVGGWTLEAAEQVVGADLDGLESLVDKSLVRHADDRFWMLETIREFAAERLKDEQEPLRALHAEFYARRAEAGWRSMLAHNGPSPDQPTSLRNLQQEAANFRAALSFAEQEEAWDLVIRLAGFSWLFWNLSGMTGEGLKWLNLARQHLTGWGVAQTEVFDGVFALSSQMGAFATLHPIAEEFVRRATAAGDGRALAIARSDLAEVLMRVGDHPKAEATALLAVDAARALTADELQRALNTLAFVHRQAGNYGLALEAAQELLAIAERHAEPIMLAGALLQTGSAKYFQEQYEPARQDLERAVSLCRESGALAEADIPLMFLGWVYLRLGRLPDALRVLDEGLLAAREASDPYTSLRMVEAMGAVLYKLGDASQARAAWSAAASARKALDAPRAPSETWSLRDTMGASTLDPITTASGIKGADVLDEFVARRLGTALGPHETAARDGRCGPTSEVIH